MTAGMPGDVMENIFENYLKEKIMRGLSDRLMEHAKNDIDVAVSAALSDMEVYIKHSIDAYLGRCIVDIVVKTKHEKAMK